MQEQTSRPSSRKKSAKKTAKRAAIKRRYQIPAAARCVCGCGEETGYRELADGTKLHSLFRQGHDARLKGMVRRGDRLTAISLAYVAGWYIFKRADKLKVGAEAGPSWDTLTWHGCKPQTWEEWRELANGMR